jgi:hypothetical protein
MGKWINYAHLWGINPIDDERELNMKLAGDCDCCEKIIILKLYELIYNFGGGYVKNEKIWLCDACYESVKEYIENRYLMRSLRNNQMRGKSDNMKPDNVSNQKVNIHVEVDDSELDGTFEKAKKIKALADAINLGKQPYDIWKNLFDVIFAIVVTFIELWVLMFTGYATHPIMIFMLFALNYLLITVPPRMKL